MIISRCFWLPEKLNSPWNLDKILLPSVSITPNAVILASMQHKYKPFTTIRALFDICYHIAAYIIQSSNCSIWLLIKNMEYLYFSFAQLSGFLPVKKMLIKYNLKHEREVLVLFSSTNVDITKLSCLWDMVEVHPRPKETTNGHQSTTTHKVQGPRTAWKQKRDLHEHIA